MVALSEIRELSDRIAKEFNPDRIILFGSHAYGTPKEHSDVDLLVIMPFEGSGLRKSVEILTRLSPDFPIDLIVRRSDETARRYAEFDPVLRQALDLGQVLYERQG